MDIKLNKRMLMMGLTSTFIINPVFSFAKDDDERSDDDSDSDNDDRDKSDDKDERDDDDSQSGSDDERDDDDSDSDKPDDSDSEDEDDSGRGRGRGRGRGGDSEYDDLDDSEESLDDILTDDSKLREIQNRLRDSNLPLEQRERLEGILREAKERFGLDDSVERLIREEGGSLINEQSESLLISRGWE